MYDVDYFIKKFEAITEDEFETGDYGFGNIIAANCGYSFKKTDTENPSHSLYWDSRRESVYAEHIKEVESDRHLWFNAIWGGEVDRNAFTQKMLKEIRSTGYTPHELALIEQSFESASWGEGCEDFMFNGLVAVLDTLAEIHQISDTDEINNERFEQHYKKRLETLSS
jgi:hypothetical protein